MTSILYPDHGKVCPRCGGTVHSPQMARKVRGNRFRVKASPFYTWGKGAARTIRNPSSLRVHGYRLSGPWSRYALCAHPFHKDWPRNPYTSSEPKPAPAYIDTVPVIERRVRSTSKVRRHKARQGKDRR